MSMFECSPTTPLVLPAKLPLLDHAQLAAVAFLARYSGRTLESYRADLRQYFQWAADVGLAPLAATRAHVELYRAWMEERGLAPATIDRRLSTVCGYYRFAHIDGCITSNPAQYVRRPRVHPTTQRGMDRGELASFLYTAERISPMHAAVAVLLGLNGLRVSEACGTDIEDLGFERGHRTLRIIGKGNKLATIPLVPRTGRTLDLAIGERSEGPILTRTDGRRVDTRTAYRWVRSIGKRAGLDHVHPHMLRAAESTSDASLARTAARSAQIEAEIAADPTRFRVLTGDRPTGHLHLGHYFGTLANRLALQRRGVETFVVIADYQVITDRDGVGPIRDRVSSLVTDYLAIGLDPEQATIFTHSAIPALHQLMLPFLSLVTDAELRRNPTVKAEQDASGGPMSALLLTYPVHQAADILFCKANLVPVGKDQLPHLEQARVVARRFDERYDRVDPDVPLFPPPEALLSQAVNVLGTDGQKMSKSRRNTIDLAMDADTTARRLRAAVTDDDRHITYDPVHRPEVANLVLIGALASSGDPENFAAEVGGGGASTLKRLVTEAVNEHLAPIRSRRAELEADPGHVSQVLAAGNARARDIADATLDEVRTAMRMHYG